IRKIVLKPSKILRGWVTYYLQIIIVDDTVSINILIDDISTFIDLTGKRSFAVRLYSTIFVNAIDIIFIPGVDTQGPQSIKYPHRYAYPSQTCFVRPIVFSSRQIGDLISV